MNEDTSLTMIYICKVAFLSVFLGIGLALILVDGYIFPFTRASKLQAKYLPKSVGDTRFPYTTQERTQVFLSSKAPQLASLFVQNSSESRDLIFSPSSQGNPNEKVSQQNGPVCDFYGLPLIPYSLENKAEVLRIARDLLVSKSESLIETSLQGASYNLTHERLVLSFGLFCRLVSARIKAEYRQAEKERLSLLHKKDGSTALRMLILLSIGLSVSFFFFLSKRRAEISYLVMIAIFVTGFLFVEANPNRQYGGIALPIDPYSLTPSERFSLNGQFQFFINRMKLSGILKGQTYDFLAFGVTEVGAGIPEHLQEPMKN